MSGFRTRLAFTLALTLTPLPAPATPTQPTPADLVLSGGKIYTVDSGHSLVEALAVKDGKIVFAGSTAEARKWIGPNTHTEPASAGAWYCPD